MSVANCFVGCDVHINSANGPATVLAFIFTNGVANAKF